MKGITHGNFFLLHSLGAWITPSPKIWRYYLSAQYDTLEAIRGDKTNHYLLEAGEDQTSTRYFTRTAISYMELLVAPSSVVETLEGALEVIMTGGPLYAEDDPNVQLFLDFFRS